MPVAFFGEFVRPHLIRRHSSYACSNALLLAVGPGCPSRARLGHLDVPLSQAQSTRVPVLADARTPFWLSALGLALVAAFLVALGGRTSPCRPLLLGGHRAQPLLPDFFFADVRPAWLAASPRGPCRLTTRSGERVMVACLFRTLRLASAWPVAEFGGVRRMDTTFTQNEDCTAASEEDISAFEQMHGVVLPSDYRAFLQCSGGGSPTDDLSRFAGTGDFVSVVFGLHQGAEWKRLDHAIQDFGHDGFAFMPIAVSNGGNYFLLRLAEPNRAAVYFWDHELESSSPPSFNALLFVADSFQSWLASLQAPSPV